MQPGGAESGAGHAMGEGEDPDFEGGAGQSSNAPGAQRDIAQPLFILPPAGVTCRLRNKFFLGHHQM